MNILKFSTLTPSLKTTKNFCSSSHQIQSNNNPKKLKKIPRLVQRQQISKSLSFSDKQIRIFYEKGNYKQRMIVSTKNKLENYIQQEVTIEGISKFEIGFMLEGMRYRKQNEENLEKFKDNPENESKIQQFPKIQKRPSKRYFKYTKLKNRELPTSTKTIQQNTPNQKQILQQNFWKNKELINNQLNKVKNLLKKKSNNLYRSLQLHSVNESINYSCI